jgi:hypothetical protein
VEAAGSKVDVNARKNSLQWLIGTRYYIELGIDSNVEFQSQHEATVIGVNVAVFDSLLLQLKPPLPKGRYLNRVHGAFQEDWRKGIEQFDKILILRRHAGYRVAPPGPSFPIVVHVYGWPDPPITRPIDWGRPDDWGELFLSRASRSMNAKGTPLPVWLQAQDCVSCCLTPFRVLFMLIGWVLGSLFKRPK